MLINKYALILSEMCLITRKYSISLKSICYTMPYKRTYMYTHTHIHTLHTRTYTHMHAYTHTHICMHTHTHKNPGGPPGTGPEFNNCKVLHSTLQLSWRVDYTNSRVRFRLCGCTSTTTKYVKNINIKVA